MAKNGTVRIRPSLLQNDRDGFAALKGIAGYAPANAEFTIAKIQTTQDELIAKRDIESQKQADYNTARDDATTSEWVFHNSCLGANDEVKAQFGPDSNEVQAVGFAKKSEFASPHKKTPTPATPTFENVLQPHATSPEDWQWPRRRRNWRGTDWSFVAFPAIAGAPSHSELCGGRTLPSDFRTRNIHERTDRREAIGAHRLWLRKHLEISSHRPNA
jgi:hypothetical protein